MYYQYIGTLQYLVIVMYSYSKTVKVQYQNFLALLGSVGKPTHFESLNSDKIRLR